MVLASTNTTSLDDFAQLADQIIEVATPSISNVTTSTEVEQLRVEIGDLKKLVQSLLTPKARHQHRSLSLRQSPGPSPSPNKESCWYHQSFGSSARKCQPPCNVSENTPGSH